MPPLIFDVIQWIARETRMNTDIVGQRYKEHLAFINLPKITLLPKFNSAQIRPRARFYLMIRSLHYTGNLRQKRDFWKLVAHFKTGKQLISNPLDPLDRSRLEPGQGTSVILGVVSPREIFKKITNKVWGRYPNCRINLFY